AAGQFTVEPPTTENPAAHEAYLKGRYYSNRRTEEGLTKGIQCFEQAVQLDPHYARAHAGLADCYLLLDSYGFRAPHDVMPVAKREALEALKLDDLLAEAHTSLASVLSDYDWDWQGAEKE